MRRTQDQQGGRYGWETAAEGNPVGVGTTSRLIPVADVAALEDWLARSHEEAVVLFNYDPWCGGNVRAHRIVRELGRDVVLVDVHAFPRLGEWVAARTGVRHESPQVLVVHEGRAVWHASHGRITAENVASALGAGA